MKRGFTLASRGFTLTSRGFTLIEVVLALAILALGVSVLSAAGTRGIGRLTDARRMEDAGTLAQRKMAELTLDGAPSRSEETEWAALEATTDLGLDHAWWRKRVAKIPVLPNDDGTGPQLTLLEVSIRIDDDPDAPSFRLATLYPPTATS